MNSSSQNPVLNEDTVDKNPFRQFEQWYGEAYRILGEDASAMGLVTATDSRPNARIVFLRGSDKKGFWFFTNYNSRKAKELRKNNRVCLLFFWARMDRQVRIQGWVEKLSAKESDRYFAGRSREKQIGAWVSPQSETIPNRKSLEDLTEQYTQQFEGKEILRPPHWGGYRLVPDSFEFWQGREYRLHDRILFRKQKKGWKIERLAP